MVKLCSKSDCSQAAHWLCPCQDPVYYYCPGHNSEVLNSEDHKIHESLSKTLTLTETKLISKKISKSVKYLESLLTNLATLTSKSLQFLIAESQKLEKIIMEKKNYYENLCKSVIKDSQIDLVDFEFLKDSLFLENSKLFTFSHVSEQKISSIFSDEIFSDTEKFGTLNDCDYLIYTDRAWNLNKIDLETFEHSKLPFLNNFPETGTQGCRLEDNKYFINGGISSTRLVNNSTTIVDLNSLTVHQKSPSSIKKFSGACVLKDSKIYSFGGFSNF